MGEGHDIGRVVVRVMHMPAATEDVDSKKKCKKRMEGDEVHGGGRKGRRSPMSLCVGVRS